MADEENPRFVVRKCGPAHDWLPPFVVVDVDREVRVGAYETENDANEDCRERNCLAAAAQELPVARLSASD